MHANNKMFSIWNSFQPHVICVPKIFDSGEFRPIVAWLVLELVKCINFNSLFLSQKEYEQLLSFT